VTDAAALTDFERELLQRSLDQTAELRDVFRGQIAHCTVTKRTWTKVGSYTDLQVDRRASPVNVALSRGTVDGNVLIWAPKLSTPAGHVIFLDEDGYLSLLEVFTYGADDVWPKVPVKWALVETAEGENPFTH
jgi:hypothetical protein